MTQRPAYKAEASWRIEAERPAYIKAAKLRFLRPYQLDAIHALQQGVGKGADRFLFEMATGTGKTLTAAAVIKLFLKSGNAGRVPLPCRPTGTGRPGLEKLCRLSFKRLQHGHLQGEPRRLAKGGDRRHDRPIPPLRQQISAPLLAHPISTSSFRTKRTARLAAMPGPSSNTSLGINSASPPHRATTLNVSKVRPSPHAIPVKPSGASFSTPIKPSAARAASQRFVIRCSTASRTVSSSIRPLWTPAPK